MLSRVLLCEQLRPRGDSVEHTTELSYQRQGSRGTDAPMDSMSVKGSLLGTSLVVQWLRIRLTMQGMQVQSLVWALDPTCFRATKPQLERNPQPSTEDHMPGASILQSYMPQLRPDTAKSIIFFKKEFSPGGIFPPPPPPGIPRWSTILRMENTLRRSHRRPWVYPGMAYRGEASEFQRNHLEKEREYRQDFDFQV